MKTIKFTACFETQWNGASSESELEVQVEDNATDQEIEEAKEDAAQEWAANYYSISWS